ncbi:hypothetical protein Dimus_029313, partial [Dionaea muscipula]
MVVGKRCGPSPGGWVSHGDVGVLRSRWRRGQVEVSEGWRTGRLVVADGGSDGSLVLGKKKQAGLGVFKNQISGGWLCMVVGKCCSPSPGGWVSHGDVGVLPSRWRRGQVEVSEGWPTGRLVVADG